MFGENMGTGTLLKALDDYAGRARDAYEGGDSRMAEDYAKSLMQGAMELWCRMVELRGEGEADEA